MFIFLSKLLPLFVYPLGLALLVLAAGLLVRRKNAWQTRAMVAAMLILFLGSSRWVALPLVRSLEWQYLPPAEIPPQAVAVVLGGGTEAADAPRPMVELNSAGDRVIYAAWLYKNNYAEAILVSGGMISWMGEHPRTPADDMAEVLILTGVPREDVWLQGRSQNTYEDALYCAQLLAERGVQRVLLVTSAMHMPRSVALFAKQGIEVIPAPTDFKVTEAIWADLTGGTPQEIFLSFIPNVSNLSLTSAALKEYLGFWVYSLRGWV